MKRVTKKIVYKSTNELLVTSVSINILVKKPTNGGTPAIDSRSIVVVVRKKLLKLNPVNDCKVLTLVVTVLNMTQKRVTNDML
jgi:hypothetical protein